MFKIIRRPVKGPDEFLMWQPLYPIISSLLRMLIGEVLIKSWFLFKKLPYCQAQSQLQLQLDWVSSIITVPVVRPDLTRPDLTRPEKYQNLLCEMEDDLNCLQREDNLNFFQMEDDLNFFVNQIQPQLFSTGRRPQTFFKWKKTSPFFKWKTTWKRWDQFRYAYERQPQRKR